MIPVKTIVSNAGGEGSVVVEKLLESSDPHWGFDAATGEYKDLVSKRVKTSIAKMFLLSLFESIVGRVSNAWHATHSTACA